MTILIFQLKKLQKGFPFYMIRQLCYTIDDYDKLFYKNAMDIIKEGEHEHMDLIYWAKPVDESENLIFNEQETEGIKWYSIEEILDPGFDSFEETKKWCKRFFDTID